MPAPTYDDVLLPDDYAPGARGGGEWKVRIVRIPSGRERRFELQEEALYKWQIDYPGLDRVRAAALLDFWHARRGGLHAFRFRDQTDDTATDEPLYPTGAPTVQLVKTYSSGLREWRRNIYAPAGPSPTNTVTLEKNGAAFSAYSLNLSTGLVTLDVIATQNITGIVLGDPTEIEFGAAPNAAFTTGSLIYLSSIVGTTQLNGVVAEVTAVNANSIDVDHDSTGYTAWASGGTAAKYLDADDELTWSGRFHVPVRFDVEWPEFGAEAPNWKFWNGVALVEVKE
jgi:uncharacterized protein (TIGR02217 family)